MQATGPSVIRSDGRLWAFAFGLSVMANIALLGLAGLAAIRSNVFAPPTAAPVPQAQPVVMIFPEMVAEPAAAAAPEETAAEKPRFARTSADQVSAPPENAAFIGERDTIATSDRAPDASAPPMPSQKGVEADDPETTESDYRDGPMTDSSDAPPTPAVAESRPTPPSPADPAPVPRPAAAAAPPEETLLQGPQPVDVPVARKLDELRDIKPTPPDPIAERPPAKEAAALPKPTPPADPAFRGYQRKAAIVGSISRSGKSALNVADSALGRYQAAISRAVEQEWQRNCIRRRDFITPGYLTVRFFVEPSGKVKTVHFVGEMTCGEVQKGFTLSSIRDAEIPEMPTALKKEYAKEPMELIFNFYF